MDVHLGLPEWIDVDVCCEMDGLDRALEKVRTAPPMSSLECCLRDPKRFNVGLLGLPVEVLSQILVQLPSSSLVACMHVDPLLCAVIRDEHFLDRYTRRVFGLSDTRDKEVRFKDLPKESSLLMELWFLCYDTHCSILNGARFFRRRNNLFFGLDCFRHSLLTWLAQATTSGTPLDNHISNSEHTNILSRCVGDLPWFVLEPLTKLMLAFPDLIEATMWVTNLSLRKGAPLTLRHAWYDGIRGSTDQNIECLYSLEVVCGQAVESVSYLTAIIISFSSDFLIVWTGNVTHFPGCRFEKTLSLTFLSPVCTVSAMKQACSHVQALVCKHSVIDNQGNAQWKRHIIYPGICHHLNQIRRKDYISLVRNISSNSEKEQVTTSEIECVRALLTGHCHGCERCSSFTTPRQHLRIDSFYDSDSTVTLSPSEMNSVTHPCTHKHIRQSCMFSQESTHTQNYFSDQTQDEHTGSSLSNRNNVAPESREGTEMNAINGNPHCPLRILKNFVPIGVQKPNRLGLIEAVFRDEILRYLCDPDSHQILCPSCSKLWLPNSKTLPKCIAQIKSRDLIPVEFWPYHILREAAFIVADVNACDVMN